MLHRAPFPQLRSKIICRRNWLLGGRIWLTKTLAISAVTQCLHGNYQGSWQVFSFMSPFPVVGGGLYFVHRRGPHTYAYPPIGFSSSIPVLRSGFVFYGVISGWHSHANVRKRVLALPFFCQGLNHNQSVREMLRVARNRHGQKAQKVLCTCLPPLIRAASTFFSERHITSKVSNV